MSNTFHRRVIVLSYFEDEMKKLNDLQREELERAVGRHVLYGLAQDVDIDTADLVHIAPCYGNEVHAAFFRTLPLKAFEGKIGTLMEAMVSNPAKIVIGAVWRPEDGKFTFHS